jgi:hypothetical protein
LWLIGIIYEHAIGAGRAQSPKRRVAAQRCVWSTGGGAVATVIQSLAKQGLVKTSSGRPSV